LLNPYFFVLEGYKKSSAAEKICCLVVDESGKQLEAAQLEGNSVDPMACLVSN